MTTPAQTPIDIPELRAAIKSLGLSDNVVDALVDLRRDLSAVYDTALARLTSERDAALRELQAAREDARKWMGEAERIGNNYRRELVENDKLRSELQAARVEVARLRGVVEEQARRITIFVMDQRRQLPADVLTDIADSHTARDRAVAERDSLRAQLAEAVRERDEANADRDAYKEAHENALASWDVDRRNLAARNDALRSLLAQACDRLDAACLGCMRNPELAARLRREGGIK